MRASMEGCGSGGPTSLASRSLKSISWSGGSSSASTLNFTSTLGPTNPGSSLLLNRLMIAKEKEYDSYRRRAASTMTPHRPYGYSPASASLGARQGDGRGRG